MRGEPLVPRLSPENAVHAGSLSQALRALARTGSAGGTRAGRNNSLRAVAAGSLQDRSSVCRAQAAHASGASTTTQSLECRRAVLIGRYRPEPKTASAIPCATTAQTGAAGRLKRDERRQRREEGNRTARRS